MRAKLIGMCAVLFAVSAFCYFSLQAVESTVSQVEALRVELDGAARAGELEQARNLMRQIRDGWEARRPILEILTTHDDLRVVSEQIIQAQSSLNNLEMDGFFDASALLGEALSHILRQERPSWPNLL